MNIMFISSDNNRYHGAFLSMVKLASLLQEQYGHNVIVVLPCNGNGKELLDENGISNILIPSYSWIIRLENRTNIICLLKDCVKRIVNRKSIRNIQSAIKENNIDIVHINTSYTYVGAKAALNERIPIVWHLREFLEEDQGNQIRFKNSGYRLMRKADKVLAISQSIYDKYSSILDRTRLSVIFNGIEPNQYYNPNHLLFQRKRIELVFVGGLYEHKKPWMAIKACVMLKERGYSNINLKIVGTGAKEYIDFLNNMIREAHAESYIELCGAVPDTSIYFNDSDISLVCSQAEAFGRVTVEAMFSGTLVIGADNAGTSELIQDNVTGLLYNGENPANLANRIEYAITHQNEMRVIAKDGQKYMMTNMTADINAERVNSVYNTLVNRGGVTNNDYIIVILPVDFVLPRPHTTKTRRAAA